MQEEERVVRQEIERCPRCSTPMLGPEIEDEPADQFYGSFVKHLQDPFKPRIRGMETPPRGTISAHFVKGPSPQKKEGCSGSSTKKDTSKADIEQLTNMFRDWRKISSRTKRIINSFRAGECNTTLVAKDG